MTLLAMLTRPNTSLEPTSIAPVSWDIAVIRMIIATFTVASDGCAQFLVVRRMRSLLAFAVLILAVIGLSGCSTRQTVVTPLPSCYPDPSNLAEFAGRCPKCGECVKGYVATEVWKVLGECPNCKVCGSSLTSPVLVLRGLSNGDSNKSCNA